MLKGRSIGLKSYMSKEEMRTTLLNKKKEWISEGIPEQEVLLHIWNKCKPLGLVSNFYWSRFPSAAEKLQEVYKELSNEGKLKIFEHVKTRRTNKTKTYDKVRHNEIKLDQDLLAQFYTMLNE